MRLYWLTRENHDRCLLFFSGWGMDFRPFLPLRPSSFDLLFVYDYRSLAFGGVEKLLAPYQECFLAAWSMGVWVAARVLPEHGLRFRRQTAVGGSLRPIDDRYGIPPDRYRSVITTIDQQSLESFYAAMFSDQHQLERFLRHRPSANLDQLQQELVTLEREYGIYGPAADCYSHRLVLLRDRIVPPRNQLRNWGRENSVSLRCGHFPFYSLSGFGYFLDDQSMPDLKMEGTSVVTSLLENESEGGL